MKHSNETNLHKAETLMDGLATISPRNLTLSQDATFKNQNISPANSEMGNKRSSEHVYA